MIEYEKKTPLEGIEKVKQEAEAYIRDARGSSNVQTKYYAASHLEEWMTKTEEALLGENKCVFFRSVEIYYYKGTNTNGLSIIRQAKAICSEVALSMGFTIAEARQIISSNKDAFKRSLEEADRAIHAHRKNGGL
jgi:hypothetical protein